MRIKYSIICLLGAVLSLGQMVFGQMDRDAGSLRASEPQVFALTNCTIVPGPGRVIHNGQMVIRAGFIESVGEETGNLPPEAVIIDCQGSWVFPGFIDAWTHYGQPEPEESKGEDPQYARTQPGPVHWNEAVKPEFEAARSFSAEKDAAEKLRSLGFTTVHSTPKDGIFRGTSLWADLSGDPETSVLNARSGSCLSFRKGVSNQEYPSSLMGAIALIRQTFLDARWYGAAVHQPFEGARIPELNQSLEALNNHLENKLSFFIDGEDYLTALRAQRIGEEFGLDLICKTKGEEYNAIEAFRKMKLIVPLDFPKAFDIKDIADARNITLERLKAWEQAPLNPAILAEKECQFALTASDLEKTEAFWGNLRKAIAHGLDKDDALQALTLTPARFLGVEKVAGSLETGKRADFFLCSGNPFTHKEITFHETWVGGKRFIENPLPELDLFAEYALVLPGTQYKLVLKGKKASAITGKDTLKTSLEVTGNEIMMLLGKGKATIRLKGFAKGMEMEGYGEDEEGKRFFWTAKKVKSLEREEEEDNEIEPVDRGELTPVTYPNKAYGFSELPVQGDYLLKNATIWTNGPDGIKKDSDVLIRNGKIVKVADRIPEDANVTVFDLGGKHITPGIIDEHSHIAISRGVNEGSHAITAEVRIGDVIRSDDINIYRQLAGGVTASQLLHGSANPIGGQSGLIKLRWGQLPEDMKIRDHDGFIKFALGENVKQSNWGDKNTIRYPQTRLGVEQLMKDAFQAALDYREDWKKWNAGDRADRLPPRRDLQLETLLEILDQKRFVTCHSYQQGEINMLMKLAESFGFRINTFTHVLEGYKVAEKIADHGASGSTFSDWWAYKYEVIDAVPHNAALMNEAGINVCINSDDAEMGRRLNQEAAKAVKYGGASEEDALKMVTLNPAIALHLDDRMGKIAPGMDADLVIWSDHPLSIYARAEKTFVDGRMLFDLERDLEMREKIETERAKIIRRMMADEGKEGKQPPEGKEERLYHCDSFGE